MFTPPYVGKGSQTVESSPILHNDSIIFGANDGFIYSVNISTGEVEKTYSMGCAVLGKVLLDNGKIYAGGFDGYVACFAQ